MGKWIYYFLGGFSPKSLLSPSLQSLAQPHILFQGRDGSAALLCQQDRIVLDQQHQHSSQPSQKLKIEATLT